MGIDDVNNVVLFNQYLDVLRSLSESRNAKTVVLPAATPGGYTDLFQQLTNAMAVNDLNVRNDTTASDNEALRNPHNTINSPAKLTVPDLPR